MSAPFTVPPGSTARLASTRPAPEDQWLLDRAVHSRRLVLLKALLARMRREPLPDAAAAHFRRDWRLLESAENGRPARARQVLDHPSTGSWLVHTLNASGPALTTALPHLGEIAVAVALRTGAALHTTVTATDGLLVLPGLGVLDARTDRTRVVPVPRGLLLSPAGRKTATVLLWRGGRGTGPGWRGLPVLPGSRARLDDIAVHRAPDAVVGHRSTAVEPARAWRAEWRGAVNLLEAADPRRAAEITGLTRSVVPMAGGRGGPSSGSLRAEPWAVHTVLPGSARRFAEVLVHELQHSKLNVLCDLVRLHRADRVPRYRVAWRADPRPFEGVLQGTYAHLALADLWDRVAGRPGAAPAARRRSRVRREEYREQVAQALPILLESGELTVEGRQFVMGMQRHHAHLGIRAGTSFARPDDVQSDGDVR
ncbi:aKG-HExxH-type peptide beta-hydroxylase [Streptomyces sp. NPDC003023]|uniref:aKG-HExxH-type peptide beta-hydroxylase n=1 Tax=Streptomyces sp. NPDC003023 TaxID=3364675 RepID=UPI0036D08208